MNLHDEELKRRDRRQDPRCRKPAVQHRG